MLNVLNRDEELPSGGATYIVVGENGYQYFDLKNVQKMLTLDMVVWESSDIINGTTYHTFTVT